MSIYLGLLAVAFGFGLADWLNKGLLIYKGKKWQDLSRFKKGYGWPVMFFGFWVATIYILVAQTGNPWYWFGLLGFINEDAAYYLYKRFAYSKSISYTYWNKWIGLWNTAKGYWITVAALNVVMLGVLFVLGGN